MSQAPGSQSAMTRGAFSAQRVYDPTGQGELRYAPTSGRSVCVLDELCRSTRLPRERSETLSDVINRTAMAALPP